MSGVSDVKHLKSFCGRQANIPTQQTPAAPHPSRCTAKPKSNMPTLIAFGGSNIDPRNRSKTFGKGNE
eukprot:1030700-Amphidinium_carterae.1